MRSTWRMWLPNWVGELALILAWPMTIAVAWTAGDLLGSWIWITMWLVGLFGWGFFCLGAFARSDPLGFASIVAPSIVFAAVALAALVTGGKATTMLASLAWVLAWTLAGTRIWPWWSRNVLRRYRPGSPEAELFNAWGPLMGLRGSASTTEDGKAVWSKLVGLQQLETKRTRPVIAGLFALWEISMRPGTGSPRRERAVARVREEWVVLWEPPRVRLPTRRAQDPIERPTSGTRLEFLFPKLEALIAVASPDQQRQIAAESARLATRDAGLASPALEMALDQAAVGRPDPQVRNEIEARLLVVRERCDELYTRHDDQDKGEWSELAREAIALSAVSEALAGELSPVEVADVVFEAIRSEYDEKRDLPYEGLVAGIVGAVAAARAVEIQPLVTSSNDTSNQSPTEPTEADISILGLQSRVGGGLLRLAVVGLGAGLLGTILRQLAWPIYAGLADAYAIDSVVGQMIVALVAYPLIRVWFGRPGFLDVVLLFVASFVSSELVGPLFHLTSNLVAPLADPAWTDFFAHPDDVVPYAPFHSLTFAAALIVGSLLLSPRLVEDPAQTSTTV
jgi:hypothetical protein